MEHRQLGRTGVSVSKFCLGAMMFGAWGNPDHDESIRIIHAALDAGINFIDTADVYGQGESEEIVGKALAGGRRDDVILATKFHNAMGEDPNQQGNSRRWIIRAVEDSLRRLGTDWIDLYQVHRLDPRTDIEETLSALSDLVHQGKVRYIGTSTFPASQIVEAQWVARDRAPAALRHRAAAVLDPRPRRRGRRPAHVPAPRHGRHVLQPADRRLAVGPLAQGHRAAVLLARRAGCPSASTSPSPLNQRKLDAVEQLAQLADEAGITLIQLAIAFVLNHPAITAALIGPRTMEQLESQLAAADVVLDAGSAGPHRRDRPARHDHQPGRQLLRQPGARAGGAPALGGPTPRVLLSPESSSALSRRRSSGGWQERALRAGELCSAPPRRTGAPTARRKSRRRVPFPDRTRRPPRPIPRRNPAAPSPASPGPTRPGDAEPDPLLIPRPWRARARVPARSARRGPCASPSRRAARASRGRSAPAGRAP